MCGGKEVLGVLDVGVGDDERETEAAVVNFESPRSSKETVYMCKPVAVGMASVRVLLIFVERLCPMLAEALYDYV